LAGTYAQHGHLNYEDQSGWFEWDDTLVVHDDGTAVMTTKFKRSVSRGWHLHGCDGDGPREASDVWTQHLTYTIEGSAVSFDRQGPVEVTKVDPPCWKHEITMDSWSLDWVGSRLKKRDGEYFRQD
jgi:hypothetical protein